MPAPRRALPEAVSFQRRPPTGLHRLLAFLDGPGRVITLLVIAVMFAKIFMG